MVEQLAFLLGTWRGAGHEEYPTVDDADYEEEMVFGNDGEPFLTYRQRAWAPDSGDTLHAESGFWRLAGDGTLEVCLGHPLGLTEVSEGRADGGRIELASRSISRTATGEPVSGVERRYVVDGDTMRYDIFMALDQVPTTLHLRAELRRV
jgi:THAP4-like, heme-binding beta-barrel domain